ncbi:alpha/beta hydrolase [Skermanella aerolata]|uniref:Alpha/beta hydrolase n=1 Tax=Skermanella aerolata TaxID=393310 RepID=A0A512DID8_9PROT|nr:alpha/beta hydrolase [Skermanella aerolata]KJB97529.1 alpha\beta hydrolase [Skermanella aerolata KACC 11604]GEO36248.1 alpha/beta hydrolase [Skermanella aerolata]
MIRSGNSGRRLAAIDEGPVDGPLVILLHGFPEFSYAWRNQVGPLADDGWRVLVPDQLGYNLSDKPVGLENYDIDALADDVLRLAESAGYRTFSLVGHDWGGIVAWWLALRDPDRIERLAILNAPHPATMTRYAMTHPTQMLRSWYILFFQIPGLPEALLRAGGYRMARRLLTGTSRGDAFSRHDLDHYQEAWSRPGALTAMINWYRALRKRRKLRSERVRVPTMILWGERDTALEFPLALAALRRCDQGRLFRFPNATHWLQHEEPEDVNHLLRAFLSSSPL